jgi:hypothetical protein
MSFQSIGDVAAKVVANIPRVEKHAITSREQWLALRKRDVTASAAGALLGVHPYVSAYGLWALKSGIIDEDPEETQPMRRGRLLEPVAVEVLREERPNWKLTYPVGTYYREPESRIGATPDVEAVDEAGRFGVVQIKSVEPSIFRKKWRDEEGTLSPPLWIMCQAIVEAYLTGATWAAVGALVVGHGIEIAVVMVPIHGGIIARLKDEVRSFWYSVENGRAPDPDLHRDAALIEKIFNPTGPRVDLSKDNELAGIVDKRKKRLAYIRKAEDSTKELRVSIIRKLGNAASAVMSDGRVLTAKKIDVAEGRRKAFTRIDIRVQSPEAN